MKTIQLTRGREALVDDDDFEWLSSFNWYAAVSGKTFYARRSIQLSNGRQTLHMHREVMQRAGHDLTGMDVDHREHDGLDNRKSMLRVVTKSQNLANQRGPQSGNTSGFLGVYFHKGTRRWIARIRVNGEQLYLGSFDKPIEAARAHDAYIIKHGLMFHTLSIPVAA